MPPKLARHGLAVSLLALVVLGAALPSLATTFTVTDTSDNAADPNSLRYAVNHAANGDTINFNLTYPATITLTNGYLEIATNVTISGPGAANLFISGNGASNVFQVDSTVTGAGATISGVTIEDGFLGVPGENGGGIYNAGTLTVSNSTVSGNATYGSDDNGGGIYNAGSLTVSGSTVSGNYSYNGDGGGIYNAGILTVSESTVSNNYSDSGSGGGIENDGTLTVSSSTFFGNSAFGGGGIYNLETLTVSNSTFSGNYGDFYAGGIVNAGTATVSFSTFSGNGGGGVFPGDGSAIQNFSNLTLKGTLLALNSALDGNCYVDGGGTSDGYNLSDDDTCSFLTAPGDQNDVAAASLSPSGLQDNGGPTLTIALLPTSPAVDAVPITPTNECTDAFGNLVKTDQRGVTRPQGTGCDIGAYELVNAQLTASPSSLAFRNLGINGPKFTKLILLSNSGPAKVKIGTASITPTGGDPAAFSVHEYCEPRTLRAGKECVIAITFEPHEAGLNTATLNIPSTAPGSPLEVALSGTGISRK
jgi:hypothetical protein